MAEPREVRVKLTVDASEYMSTMGQALAIAKDLRACGIAAKDMPDAIAVVQKIAACPECPHCAT